MNINGILLVNKEENCTSRDVVNQICKKFGTKKVGHCGTLDPFATGLLILGVNKGTGLMQYIEAETKEYVAGLKLGTATDTFDLTGVETDKKEIPSLSEKEIKEALNSFLGISEQEVPKFSAIKVNGKKLYEYAREGKEIDLPRRNIKIDDIELLSFKDDIINFRVIVSKGTYIRSLGVDIAKKLGSVGHLVSLKRTSIGKYTLENAKQVNDIENTDVIPLIYSMGSLPLINVDEVNEFKVKNGAKINLDLEYERVVILSSKNEVIAIYKKYLDLYVSEKQF